MYTFDQDIRNQFLLHPDNENLRDVANKMDLLHISYMKKILKEWGWVTISKFGVECDQQAWILVQHADDDMFFQAGVLYVLGYLVDKGETSKKNYAYLYDRVAAKFHGIGMSQRYGTQLNVKGAEIELQPYEGTVKDVNKRRSEIGLESLQEYLDAVKKIYKNLEVMNFPEKK